MYIYIIYIYNTCTYIYIYVVHLISQILNWGSPTTPPATPSFAVHFWWPPSHPLEWRADVAAQGSLVAERSEGTWWTHWNDMQHIVERNVGTFTICICIRIYIYIYIWIYCIIWYSQVDGYWKSTSGTSTIPMMTTCRGLYLKMYQTSPSPVITMKVRDQVGDRLCLTSMVIFQIVF